MQRKKSNIGPDRQRRKAGEGITGGEAFFAWMESVAIWRGEAVRMPPEGRGEGDSGRLFLRSGNSVRFFLGECKVVSPTIYNLVQKP